MTVLLLLAAALLLLACLTPYMPARPWLIIDLPSHFVAQYAIGAVLLLPLAFFLQSCAAVVLLLWSLLLCLLQLKPFLLRKVQNTAKQTNDNKAGKAAPLKPDSLKILQANLLMTNRDTGLLRALILAEHPDLVTCAEVTPAFATMLEALKAQYPHQMITPGHRGYRVAVISTRPFLKVAQADFCGARTQSLVFTLELGGKPVEAVSLHPFTPIAHIANRDNEFAAIAARFIAEKPERLLLMGDLNATPWCPALKKLTRALGLTHARAGTGVRPSWPAWLPFAFLRLPIDHVLLGPNLAVTEFRLGPSIGSDHLPTLTRVSLLNS